MFQNCHKVEHKTSLSQSYNLFFVVAVVVVVVVVVVCLFVYFLFVCFLFLFFCCFLLLFLFSFSFLFVLFCFFHETHHWLQVLDTFLNLFFKARLHFLASLN